MNSSSFEITVLCFASLNTSCPQTVYSLSLRLSLYFSFISIIIMTTGGNLLVILVMTFSQNHYSSETRRLILSLSVAGLLLGGFVMPLSMVRSIETCWYFGHIFCDLHTATDIIVSNTTIWHLMFISVDRYLAIFRPLHYHHWMTNKTSMVMIGFSWGLASVFAFIIVIWNPVSKESCDGGCFSLHSREIGVEYVIFFYCIPVFVMLCVYCRIFGIAQKHAKAILSYTRGPNSTALDFKATKTLTVVVGNFFICWTPYFICNIVDPLLGHSVHSLVYEVLMWVVYLNAMLNPLIYVFFYRWFREIAKVLLTTLCQKLML